MFSSKNTYLVFNSTKYFSLFPGIPDLTVPDCPVTLEEEREKPKTFYKTSYGNPSRRHVCFPVIWLCLWFLHQWSLSKKTPPLFSIKPALSLEGCQFCLNPSCQFSISPKELMQQKRKVFFPKDGTTSSPLVMTPAEGSFITVMLDLSCVEFICYAKKQSGLDTLLLMLLVEVN